MAKELMRDDATGKLMRDVASGKLMRAVEAFDCECFDPGTTPKYYTVDFRGITECTWEGGPWPSNANRMEVLTQDDVMPCIWKKTIDGLDIYLNLAGSGRLVTIGWTDGYYFPSHLAAFYHVAANCVLKEGIFNNQFTVCGEIKTDGSGGQHRAHGIDGTVEIEPGSHKIVEGWSQKRLPTGDSAVQWDRSAGGDSYLLVDDPFGASDDDSTYTYTDVQTNKDLFGFTAFTVPSGSTITSVKVVGRFRRVDAGGAEIIRELIRVNGVTYEGALQQLLVGAYFNKEHTWTTNPNTGLPWTIDDIKGIGSNPLQTFGYECIGFNKAVRCTQVYVQVNYDY